MIKIDIPMPCCCAECRLLRIPDKKEYFQCMPDGRYMYDEDKVWMTEQRPNWCPLIDVPPPSPMYQLDWCGGR